MKSLVAVGLFASFALASVACGSSSSGGDAKPAGMPGTFQQASAKASLGQSVGSIANIKTGGSGAQSAATSLLASATGYEGFVTPGAASAGASSSTIGMKSFALGTCDCKGNTCTFTDCGDDPNSKMNGTTSVTGDHVVIDLKLVTTQGPQSVTIAMKCDLMMPADGLTGTCTTDGDVKTNSGGMAVDVSFSTAVTYALKVSGGMPTGGSIDVSSSTTYAGQTYSGSGKVMFP